MYSMNCFSFSEKSKITFDQLCSLREKVRHLRLELNQLKRAHANQVTASQLMIRDASQKSVIVCSLFISILVDIRDLFCPPPQISEYKSFMTPWCTCYFLT